MAIVLESQPNEYGLVYNDNPFVFRSTNYTPTQRFKVVILPSDFPVSPAIATVRIFPRNDTGGNVDRAYFDPSRILQSLVSSDIAIPDNNHDGFFPCNNSHKEYGLFIAEEDKNASGVYVEGDTLFTNVRSVWNGVQDLIDWVDFDYNLYIMGTAINRFLTQSPRTQYVDTGNSYFLHFIATSQNNGSEYTINVYDESGSNTFTSQITNPNAAFINSTFTYKYQRIAVGPYDIANIEATLSSTSGINTCLNGASYYTVQLTNSATAKSELFTFYLNARCSKYTPIRLQWLNRLGGYDSYNFNYKSEVSTDVKRENYVQQHHSFTGSAWSYDKASRGLTAYDMQSEKKLRINTGYVTDEEAVWLEDLFTSPVVYIEQSNELIAVNVDGRSIKRQTSLNDKLAQYSFDLEYALTNIRQRG